MNIIAHPRIVLRHPELSEDDVKHAWENAIESALRIDSPNFPEYIRIGLDEKGRLIEVVGTQAEDGWLIYHAMTPPSKKTMSEIEKAKRRS